jgi:acetoin utilization deacetylase AcuC-like enzyme
VDDIRVITPRHSPVVLPYTLDRDGGVVAGLESDERVRRIIGGLRSAGRTTILPAEAADMEVDAAIGALHERDYIEFLRNQSGVLQDGAEFMADTRCAPGVRQDTPIVPNAYAFAREGVRAAISAAKAISSGARCAYAVCRPPGHHAGSGWFGGYCYFNNAVAAACEISAENKTRVGIVDIDFHFGNGSAELASTRRELFFASLHASTATTYPYIEPPVPGDRQVFVAFESPPAMNEYLEKFSSVLDAVRNFGCNALVVSVGYDIIARDPHGGWLLPPRIFQDIGALLGQRKLPVCLVQEGGYLLARLDECAYHLAAGLMLQHS